MRETDLKYLSERRYKAVEEEAKNLQDLSHPNLLRHHEAYAARDGKQSIVMEYAAGGDL